MNTTLGRYVPHNTFIHRLDARFKVFALICLMVAVFISYDTYAMSFVIGGLLAAFILMLLIISKVSIIDVFKSLKVLWFFIILLMVINIFFPPVGAEELHLAFNIGKVNVYWESIYQSLKITIRLILMIELTMILTATTKPLDLTYGLEWYMKPLKVVKFPAHEVAMTISIALRFIPTLLDETQRIMKAQASRGVDFKHGKIGSKIKAIVSLIVPLFISSFQRSEELADSMEARGYDPKGKRTRYRVLKFSTNDLLSTLIVIVLMVGTIVISKMGIVLETPHFIPWYILSILVFFIYLIIIGIVNASRRAK